MGKSSAIIVLCICLWSLQCIADTSNQIVSTVERVLCLAKQGKCSHQFLQCPSECPKRKPADPKAKACFIDCGPKCEASCRNRIPSCNGFGSVCYDPRFVGGDGVMFYFHGIKDRTFCLVSDANLHINAHFIGSKPKGRPRDYTWLHTLGILFSSHSFTVGTNKVQTWNDSIDHLSFSFDNCSFVIPETHISVWTSPDESLTVERTAKTNSVNVHIHGLAEISVRVVPISEEDNRVHNYQLPPDDCFAHLDLQFKFFNLSAHVDGILGQTYRPDFQNPVKVGVSMPVMGGEKKYITSSLLSPDCLSCSAFAPNVVTASAAGDAFGEMGEDHPAKIIPTQCSSGSDSAGGIVCRR
eukprot:Gb_00316 [translate_table: standard]